MATVAVGTTPQQIQLTPDGSKLFVSNEASNTVSVICTGLVPSVCSSTDAVIGSPIAVGLNPGPIRFTPNGAKAYVVNEDSDTVSVINVATHAVSAPILVGDRPITLSRTDDGAKVFVANELSNNVSVICTGLVTSVCSSTDAVIGLPIAVGVAPHTMAKTPDGTKLYVANEGAASNSISVINTATNAVDATISLSPSQDPGSIQFLPNGTKAYVANRGCAGLTCSPEVDPTVSVIDVAMNTVTTISGPGFGVGDAPHAMRITPDGSKLYVVNKHGDEVMVIGTATNTILRFIQLQQGSCTNLLNGIGSCPVRIELNADGSKAYVVEERPLAANGVLTIICTGLAVGGCTDTVIGSVTVGNDPVDLEMTSSKAYVSNSASNNVSVVALAVDSDGDGCTDVQELGPNHHLGGQRDPHKFWDYPDMPPRDKRIRVGDVSYVIQHYRHDQGGTLPPLYDPQADHSLLGPNVWNLGQGDGLIRINDVSNVIQSYRDDCA